MVLEALVSVQDAVKNTWHVVLFGAGVSFVSIVASYFVFPGNAGLLTVFLMTMIAAPLMLKLLWYEEYKEEKEIERAKPLDKINPLAAFSRQSETFVIYSAFFVGAVIALSITFIFLPENFVSKIFNDQITELGKAGLALGQITGGGAFTHILLNNLIVTAVAFVFALLFGVGAIFILAWNASVLSAALGLVTKSQSLSTAILTFLPHGIFEIAAYFAAAIAGGIISIALTKRDKKELGPVVKDMILIMVLAVALVLIGALIESVGAA